MIFWQKLLRVGVSFILGSIVGWEREQEGKPAGLRTIILVSTGAALFTVITYEVVDLYGIPDDGIRIISGIAQGIGFLGAGTIFITGGSVQGLTTAAAIWAMAAVGIACALGMWDTALLGTLLTFLTLRVLDKIEGRLSARRRESRES
jgi:putative Mg2+ transporter-C (MgtC) family protein